VNSGMLQGLLLALAFLPLGHAAGSTWVLQKSELTYHVSHPLHQSEGVSHAAKGKGTCRAGECDFLIAAPVKSFDSAGSELAAAPNFHALHVLCG
jgi:hypothetical protein